MSSKARFLCICWLGSTQKRIRNLVKHLWGAFLRKNIKELIKAVSYICIKAPSRSSHRRCFIVLQNSKENTCIEAWEKETPKETSTHVFSCELCKIFKTTFLQNTCGRLLLHLWYDSDDWTHFRPLTSFETP